MPRVYHAARESPVNVIDIVATASFYLDFVMTQLQRDHDVLEFFRCFVLAYVLFSALLVNAKLIAFPEPLYKQTNRLLKNLHCLSRHGTIFLARLAFRNPDCLEMQS